MNKFKVGDRVKAKKFGEGVVESVDTNEYNNFPIGVKFNGRSDRLYYTVNGNLVYYALSRPDYKGFDIELIDTYKEFKVRDIVEAFGVRGTVHRVYNGPISDQQNPRTVHVDFDGIDDIEYFYADGRLEQWHRAPSLKLIERPKKKVKKQFKSWGNVYPGADDNDISNNVYLTKEEADEANDRSLINRIACVELKGEYEVEE